LLRNTQRRFATLALIAVAALGATSCAGNKKPRQQIAYQERPVELLYATGADRLDNKRWNEAVDYFQEVERQHPYSEWSRRSILMTAYAHYQANQYTEAMADADRFISLYPGNPSTVYAYYLKAICYFEQIVDVGRDQAATEQALGALRDVMQRYPNTEYARDARLKIDMVNDQLAGKEMAIGRYYLRQNQPVAAIGRFRTVIDRYQTTSHTPEALYRLVEVYLTMGLLDEAKKNGAVLGYNFPGRRLVQRRLQAADRQRPASRGRAEVQRRQAQLPAAPDRRQGHHPEPAGRRRSDSRHAAVASSLSPDSGRS
jgi:outer membrane protein assembly factor BamD